MFFIIKGQGQSFNVPLPPSGFVSHTDSVLFVSDLNSDTIHIELDSSSSFGTSSTHFMTMGEIVISGLIPQTYFWRAKIKGSSLWMLMDSFSVYSLEGINSKDLWLEPNQNYQSNSNNISEWSDMVSGYDFSQSNSVFQPKLVQNKINGNDVIEFGQNGITYLRSSVDYVLPDDFTAVFVYKNITQTILGQILSTNLDQGFWLGGSFQNRGIGLYDGIDDGWVQPNSYSYDWNVCVAYNDRIFLNGVQVSTSPYGDGVSESFLIDIVGAGLAFSTYFAGYSGDILIFNEELPDSTRVEVENYLKWKYTPFPYIGCDTIVCGSSINLGFRTDHGYSSIEWSTGDVGVDSITATQNGWHWVEVESFGITLRDSVFIDGIVQTPQMSLIQDEIICYGDSLEIIHTPVAGFSPTWSTGETTNSIWVKDTSQDIYITHEDVNGCSATSDSYFVRIDSLILKSTLGPDKNICDGANIFVSTSSQDGPFDYDWSTGDTTPTTSTNTLGIQDVDLVLTDINGCLFYDTITINALSIPAPNVAFEYDTACPLLPTFFTDLSTSGGTDNIIDWKWSFYQNDSAFIENPSYAFNAGNYTISLTVETDSGCINTGFQNIITHNQPLAKMIQAPICAETGAAFESNSLVSVPDFIQNWLWNVDGDTYTGESVSLVVSNEGIYPLQHIAISNQGCIDTLIDTVEVFPALLPNFNTTKVCLGDSVGFVDKTNSLSVVNWLWDFGYNNSFSAIQNPEFLYPAIANDYNVTLYVENAIGCENQITQNIIINPLPVARWEADTFCTAQLDSVFDTSIALGDSIISWSWIVDNDTLDSQNIAYSFPDTGQYVVDLSILTANGCLDDTTGVISVYGIPNPQFSFTPTYGTAPIDIQFINESTNADFYDWSFGDSIGVSSDENPIYNYADNGIYNVTLLATSQYGCIAETTDQVELAPSDLDIALSNLTLQTTNTSHGFTTIIPTVQIDNVGTRAITSTDLVVRINNENASLENWTGNINIGGADLYTFGNALYSSSIETVDYVCIEAINTNDGTEVNFTNNKVCALVNEDLLKMSKPYPNPTSDVAYIDLVLKNQGTVQIDIIEISGKIVQSEENVPVIEGYNQLAIDIRNMQTGDYIIMVKHLNDEYKERFTIVNK